MSNKREANAKEIPMYNGALIARCIDCGDLVRVVEPQKPYRELIHYRTGRRTAICETCYKDFNTRARYIGAAWNEGKKFLPIQ
jgi:hypothetical protein